MPWQLRHQGSPESLRDLSFAEIAEGLRNGRIEPTDEVLGPGDSDWQAIENHADLSEIAEEVERPPERRHVEPTSLDMNALIDVCLVLLIFFILTTTYAAAVQKVVPLPSMKADAKKARPITPAEVKNRMVRLQAFLDKAGRPMLRLENQTIHALTQDGQSVDPDKLRDALVPYVRGPDRKTEMLLDAREISWGTVIAIQDGARAAGIQMIHLPRTTTTSAAH
ncbi:MAG: biopolymer transporter ExbD [Gemmataceae bacterium]|nr:biopolymer transporter ExbD [Gemmataceae bacterium]MCI0740637.1 biopolymer transporter ExbD [Gemmataceae bacterium]